MKRGIATFTLDTGHCPPWLFQRMVALGREIIYVLVDEYGPDEFVRRLADPVWFQSLGIVLAFDWNASGLTTILTAALKEAIRGEERNLGIFICGGKGKTSLKTPLEIENWGRALNFDSKQTHGLKFNSKMAAKVDSSLIQDGYQIYHHAFIFSKNGAWAVVQQGMNTMSSTARRYHWYDELGRKDFTEEPHTGIASQVFQKNVLNLVAKKSRKNKDIATELVSSSYSTVMKDVQLLRSHFSTLSKMISLKDGSEQLSILQLSDEHFTTHPVVSEDFGKSKYLEKIIQKITYEKPQTYEQFLATEGVGPKTIRALSLVSEVIYGAEPSYEDPARYSFALGGKDNIPYPVDRPVFDKTISLMQRAIGRSKINLFEKEKALRRLDKICK
ncbi:MAG: hypothetical protein HW400_540 [Candidatus Levybacteria bacterium]|nr:hypothetical protein [Candidatus Levybacteria bacterium]